MYIIQNKIGTEKTTTTQQNNSSNMHNFKSMSGYSDINRGRTNN